MPQCNETEINTPPESKFIADQNGTFIFFNRTSMRKVMSFWMRTIRKLISITRGTYNARKFWTRRTSGSVRRRTITRKYAYRNLKLHSGSPTHAVVMHFRSSARVYDVVSSIIITTTCVQSDDWKDQCCLPVFLFSQNSVGLVSLIIHLFRRSFL